MFTTAPLGDAAPVRSVRAALGLGDGLWEWCVATDRVWMSPEMREALRGPFDDTDCHRDDWLSVIHPDDSQAFLSALNQCADAGRDLDCQVRLRMGAGGFRWQRMRAKAFRDADGTVVVVSGGVQDIHAHRIAADSVREQQQLLMQRQRMEALDCLAGGIAHEFNNVLQAVTGYVTFAREDLPVDSGPYHDLGKALTAAGRATQLTRDLLHFARSDEAESGATDANDVIEGLVDLMRPVLREDIDIRISKSEAPLPIKAEVLDLRQSLLNLCINSRDAMPEGGHLTVSAQPFLVTKDNAASVGGVPAGQYCRLMVTDTGCGIDPLDCQRVFQPFYTTKDPGSGTGLGLAAVYSFVQRSGGHAAVYSAGPNRGAAFSLYLPVEETAMATLEETREAAGHATTSGTVLLIEDDQQVQEVTRRMLEAEGYEVLCESDGESGLETYILHADRVSLVLLDTVLPGLSGRRVFEEIRRLQAAVPVVFCTGYDPASLHADEAGRLGEAVLAKPFDHRHLLQVVHRAVSGSPTPELSA